MNDFFLQQCQAYFKEEYIAYLETLKEPCTQGFFLNTAKAKKNSILSLIDFSYQKTPFANESYQHNHDSIGKTIVNDLGLIYPQETAASLPVSFLDTEDAKLIVDLCAAPGGKSIDVLNKCSRDCLLISNDVNHERALELSRNLERLGFGNVIITNKKIDELQKQLESQADIVILDAPCSGEGMIRKYPEIADMISESYIAELAKTQAKLLDAAYEILKPGGQLLYSTCTYAFEEDELQVRSFLKRYEDMSLISIEMDSYSEYPGTVKLCPLNGTEGQFFALFHKSADRPSVCEHLRYLKETDLRLFSDFIKDNLDLNHYYLYQYNGHCYLSLQPLYDLENSILRYGIYAGDIVKDRFEPAHHLYRCNLLEGSFRYVYDLNEEELKAYLEGRELKASLPDHFYQITYQGHSLGFAKCAKGILKNKYPKGLRRVI